MVGFMYKFVESAAWLERRRLVCPLCRHVMRDPVRVRACGHRYCDTCLQDYLSDGVFKCPQDKTPLDYAKIYGDPEIEESIMALSIKCIHHKDGCKWQDKMKHLQTHLLTCKFNAVICSQGCGSKIAKINLDEHIKYTCSKRISKCEFCKKEFTTSDLESHTGNCPFEVVYCECKCGARMQRRFLANHTVNECPKRSVPCKFCNKQFVFETIQNHLHTCPRYPVSCPNRCESSNSRGASSIKIPREDVEGHLIECPSNAIQCQFQEMGCAFKGPRQSVERHVEEGDREHMKLVCALVLSQREMISRLTERVEQMSRGGGDGGSPAASPVASLLSAGSDTSPGPLPVPVSATDGTLLWKIPAFSRRLEEARRTDNYELTSPVFTTSRYGYRLQASMFPNGNGAGDGSHLSLYIRILPGDYDALLQWPFTRTVSFTLYDQCSAAGGTAGGDKRQNVVESFVPDPNWNNFQRPPVTGAAPTLGFGFPQYVSHAALSTRHYVRDDVVFIKVRVDYPHPHPPHGTAPTPAPAPTPTPHLTQHHPPQPLNDSFNKENRTADIITNIG